MDRDMLWDAIPPNMVTHFKPYYHFIDWLKCYVGEQFVIEVGAGQCEFTKAMIEHGIKACAVEPRASDEVRRECGNFLFPMSVQRCKLLKSTPAIVISARPDHSGWFRELPELIHPESELLYIGLHKNLDIDLPDSDIEMVYEFAGQDDECVWRIN